MMSRRLKWAVSAQIVASAALVWPAMAHWDPGDCTEVPAEYLRACDQTCEINNIGTQYHVHVDGYACSLSGEPVGGPGGNEFQDEAGDAQEAMNEVCPELMEQCEAWQEGEIET